MRAITDRPHWSYSSLSQYMRCPLQYYFERVLRLPRKNVSDAQVLGSAIHAALADYHRQIQAKESAPARKLREFFLSAWEDQAGQFEVVYDRRSRDENLALGVALIEAYLREPPRRVSSPSRPRSWPRSPTRGASTSSGPSSSSPT